MGDPSKAEKILGWRHTTPFAKLVEDMMSSDLELLKNEGYQGQV